MNKTGLLMLLLCVAGISEANEIIHGKVVSVADGDTLTILDSANTQYRVRLAQIDAPEISHGRKKPAQPFGVQARQSLAELAFQQEATAICGQTDRYRRKVCTIMVGNRDVNLEQVKQGYAMVYRKYAHDPVYYAAEKTAQSQRAGLWSEASPTPPWDWRHSAKN